MRGDRYTLRLGQLVDLSRERRCNSHAVKVCFKKVFRRLRSGFYVKDVRELVGKIDGFRF